MLNEVRDNTLYFDGCSTVELARQYGTPLYVFSESEIVRRCSELRRCFLTVWPNTRAAYACKAFCTPAMLRLVQREGLCIDVVSGGELYTAIQAGFPADRIEFNGNNKLRAELELAVDYGIGRVILDGLQELPLLEEICAARGKKMNVLYRVTPGIQADSHDYIVTGRKDSKFGIPLDDDVLYPAVRAALDSKWVNFLGFHFHVGSQLFDNAPYLAALEVVLGLVREVRRRFGHTVAELNLGGGFGVTYTDEARPPDAEVTGRMEGDAAVIAATRALAGGNRVTTTYTVYPSGAVNVRMHFAPGEEPMPEMPRYGVRFRLPERMDAFAYFGRGPEENYWDRKAGTFVGRYETSARRECFPYVRPQETGHHCDTEWIDFGELLIVADSTMEFNALRCTVEDLDGEQAVGRDYQWHNWTKSDSNEVDKARNAMRRQTHVNDIPVRDFVEVCLDYRQMGLGGYDSWGKRPEESVTLRTGKLRDWGFTLVPKRARK